MPPRLYIDRPIEPSARFELPAGPARHAQVLRLQAGDALTLFDGRAGEWAATVVRMGRSSVEVAVGAHEAVERELARTVTLALGMPANDRMDMLIEKATELGVSVVQPLVCERSVLRLSGERAAKKVEHWRGVAVAASEQSGRTRVPRIEPVRNFDQWLADLGPLADEVRTVLSPLSTVPFQPAGFTQPICLLSGPEGGFTDAEEAAARTACFNAASLGPRVLRADTAPLAALAALALASGVHR